MIDRSSTTMAGPGPSARERQASVPSTAAQRDIWLASRVSAEASLAFNNSFALHVAGPLDLPSLKRALAHLIQRHDALRATFSDDGLTLRIAPALRLEIPIFDGSGCTDSERESVWTSVRTRAVTEPFDLERGPLVRVSVMRVGALDHRVVFAAHQAIVDGWSTRVLIDEWAAIYSAFARDLEITNDPAPSFAEYATQQAALVASTTYADDEHYWRSRFSNDAPALDLPTDRPRPPLKTFRSQRAHAILNARAAYALRGLADRHHTNAPVVMLAGVNALLHRLTSQDDIVVGIPVAAQALDDLSGLVGPCVQPLPIRTRVDGGETFGALVDRVRDNVLDATRHRTFSLPHLHKCLARHRDPSRLPLVSVLFNGNGGLDGAVAGFDGLTVNASTNIRQYETFELSLDATEIDGEIRVGCHFNADLFDASTIERWLAGFARALNADAIDTITVNRLPVVDEETRRLLTSWNATTTLVPSGCVHELIEAQIVLTPHAIAAEHRGETITYAELNRRANQLAHRLRAEGVQRDTLVGLYAGRSIATLVGVLGILKAGGAYVPLDPGHPIDRLSFMMNDSRMPALVTERALHGTLPSAAPVVVELDDPALDAQDATNLERTHESADADSLAYVIYTSGSTGRPKGVLVPHRAVVNLLASVRTTPGMKNTDVVLAITTLAFDIAASEILLPLTVGARIVMADRETASDGRQLARLIHDRGVTFVDATPSTWRLLIDAGWTGPNERRSLTAICTGEAMPRDLAQQLVERGCDLWNGYGPTETTVWSTFWQVPDRVDRVLIGAPIANTQIFILDAHRQQVPIGVPGELYIGGAGVARGYLNRPELANERFIANPFDPNPASRLYRTGDIARFLSTGQIECLGRNDDQIKLRGFRIELGEIEQAIAAQPSVSRVAVAVREDRGDRRLVAYIVDAADQSATDGELRAHLQTTLPDYMIPSAFVRLPELPLTPSGKVDRRALPAPAATGASTARFVAPRTTTEVMIAELWEQALGVPRVGAHDDFFALGGHSLLASQVLARLRRDHGVDILFRTLFELPTVAQFAELVDRELASSERSSDRAHDAIVACPHEGPGRLSAAQARMLMLEAMNAEQHIVHNLGGAWTLSGALNESALERSVREIAARHELLRTSFHTRADAVVQDVASHVAVTLDRVSLAGTPVERRETALRALFDAELRKPFDVERAPLFRAMLIRVDVAEHVLFIVPHNLVWDGWSFDVFLNELDALYTAFAANQPSPLAPPPIQYRDFSDWHREWLAGQESQRQRAWWRTQLDGELPVLDLPTDRPRPATSTRDAAAIEATLAHDQVEPLLDLARESGATLFTILFAAFSLLLHRLSGQDDVLVGTPVRARTRPETEDLLGPFMNMLVLRSRIDPQMTFGELLAATRETTLDAFSHQELPLEALDVQAPVLRAFFSFADARRRPQAFGGLRLAQIDVAPPKSAADIRLEAVETDAGVNASLIYSTELFDRDTMERFLGRFHTLLRSIVRRPNAPIVDLEIVSDAERAQIDALATPAPIATIDAIDSLAYHARRTPDRPALVDASTSISYGDLQRRVDAFARGLAAHGISTGSRVGLLMPRGIELAIARLGVLRAGGVWLSFDAADPPALHRQLARTANLDVMIDTRRADASRDSWSGPVFDASALINAGKASPAIGLPTAHADAVACLTHTIDPTGAAVISELSRGALNRLVCAIAHAINVNPNDELLAIAPPGMDVSIVETLVPMLAGGRVRIAGDDALGDPGALNAATLMIAPADVWRRVIAFERQRPALKTIVIGEPPDLDLVRQLAQATSGVWMAHGFAEHGIWSTLGHADGDHWMIGRPLAQTIRVVDAKGHDAPIGVAGELIIVDDADSRAQAIHTGERARWSTSGDLELVRGRTGEIDVNGYRAYTSAIASVLRHHPAIADAMVARQTQPGGESRLIAFIVTHPGVSYTDTELRRAVRNALPERLVPRAFTEVDALPQPLDDAWRPQSSSARILDDDDYVLPSTDAEHVLADVWQHALNLPRVGVHDNFFALGGYSLLCFQVIEKIEQRTGRRLNPRQLLLDSLRQIAATLERPTDASDQTPKVHGNAPAERTSSFFRRLGNLVPGRSNAVH